MRFLLSLILLFILLLGSLVTTAVSFFLIARFSQSKWMLIGGSMVVLLLVSAAAAWFMAPRLGIMAQAQFAGLVAVVMLLITAVPAVRFIFTPAAATYNPPQPRPDTQYWTLPTGSRLAYTHFTAVGQPQPIPIIYLHGGPGIPTRAANYDFYSHLAEDGFDVYMYDQVGAGLSDTLPDISQYGVARHVADLEAIRQALSVPQLIVIGTSWGAVLAAHYMAAYPDHVAQAVLLSPGVLGDRRDVRYDHTLTASSEYSGVVLPPARFVVAGLLARINPGAAVAFAPEAEMRGVYDSFTSNPVMEYQSNCAGFTPSVNGPTRSGGGNYYVNLLTLQSLKRTADPRPALQEATTAVLIIRGACDYIPMSATQRYLDSLPNARLVEIANSGHALISAQPEQVLAAIRAFLRETP